MTDSASAAFSPEPFLDSRAIEWANVRRVRSRFNQRFHYAYPGPIANLRQRLIVIPADQHGAQRLCSHSLQVDPTPSTTRQQTDRFGNRIFELEVSRADACISFEVQMTVEREAHPQHQRKVTRSAAAQLLKPTRLTQANAEIEGVARQLQGETADSRELAQSISDWVYRTMHYQSGVTTVMTTAAQALALRHGLCQDYAHLMLALCRSIGLPAGYVSGHMLGEGGSHAWVEVMLPTHQGYNAFAFDPTNNRHPDLRYITVAVGRDYHDVAPTSGSYTAPYCGQLTCSKRAGLTLVEYHSGDIQQSTPLQ